MSRSLQFIKTLKDQRKRVFSTSIAKEIYEQSGLNPKNAKIFLSKLREKGWIHSLRKGLYTLDDLFLEGVPIHEFEIAMSLAKKASISFYSAFHYHQLTEQLPRVIFVSVPSTMTVPLEGNKLMCHINGIEYRFFKQTEGLVFGYSDVWINREALITITDLERTLLDGLRFPQYCGGFQEVFHAFKISKDRINKKKIIDYALQMERVTIKRLGYMFEVVGIGDQYTKLLLKIPVKSYNKLDPTKPRSGRYNKKWMLVENI